MKKAIVAACAALSIGAHADTWTGQDKAKHLGVSAAIGAVTGTAIEDKRWAFAAALLPGIAKEVYDMRHPATHTASWQDMAANAAGAALGVYLGGVVIRPHFIGYQTEF